ncbi:hypothetical protein L5515_002088 [Caenorhabditis briggsae]|uniref:Uncharacterized protein n=1 Tax=Caenorhabditis briggsae TaxID=6238 RepID=A0AAE9J4N5_CAEBR|nr:hypothetical protein L5515_002088 [Caenorhabditis briggsae]
MSSVLPMEEPTETVSAANTNTEIDIMDILEIPRAPDKTTKPRKKRARTFPLEYWKVEPPWQQIEEEIDEAIFLTWKEQDRVANNKIQMALDKKKEMAETSKIDSKKAEEVKIQEPTVKKVKIQKEFSNETKQARLEKLKACQQRITEKRKTKKLQGQEKRKEDLLKKYGSIELRKLKM